MPSDLYERIEKLKKLGINTTTLDMKENEEYEEDIDKLKASILIMEDKEVTKELEQKIFESNKKKSQKIIDASVWHVLVK